MPSMMRRMRTRLPTYLSTGLGALVDISNTPWDYACKMRQNENGVCLRRQYRQILLGGLVGIAEILSNKRTGSVLGYRSRMRIAQSVCQLVDFRLPKFLPTAERKREYAGVRNFTSQRAAE